MFTQRLATKGFITLLLRTPLQRMSLAYEHLCHGIIFGYWESTESGAKIQFQTFCNISSENTVACIHMQQFQMSRKELNFFLGFKHFRFKFFTVKINIILQKFTPVHKPHKNRSIKLITDFVLILNCSLRCLFHVKNVRLLKFSVKIHNNGTFLSSLMSLIWGMQHVSY